MRQGKDQQKQVPPLNFTKTREERRVVRRSGWEPVKSIWCVCISGKRMRSCIGQHLRQHPSNAPLGSLSSNRGDVQRCVPL